MDNPVEEHVEETPAPAPSQSPELTLEAVPVGTPLAWPIADIDGTLLFAGGTILATADERTFLFTHFKPQRGDLLNPAAPAPARADHQTDSNNELTIKDMHLEIGALIGIRPQVGSAAPMLPCRIIGFAPNHALFVTPPLHQGRPLALGLGENIEIVAIASQAVFRFVCTVESICRAPFDYVVLSRPGAIRRLRERKSIRVQAHLPVRFGIGETGDSYEGLGLAKGISALGMSLTASWTLGAVGERLRVAYHLKSADLDTAIETTAVIRNVQKGSNPGDPTSHGLELDQLDVNQQMAMKVYVFDRQDDVQYWSNSLR
ncbi:c-di-GMP-binding flagellar brake protein YcgR, contains PilZNR and PilZ domains [Paraburkholderia fungorum]|uniref:C-di-GMP-binding flagellar brake protein YcgR, contains PilZNR and PilZ domains n=1 Tax=Paraburkholderia fungorum TaxID=134537 RepID=A0A1H1HT03_9BURK|nr:flagellar brake protein [Paraburkholderia fungorum]SDR28543.1 c-di-GMP-binding flagellar brake protein YcgR, contains PilZNR and PilZ domains [Paraburkholderia fungorum]